MIFYGGGSGYESNEKGHVGKSLVWDPYTGEIIKGGSEAIGENGFIKFVPEKTKFIYRFLNENGLWERMTLCELDMRRNENFT